MARVEHVNKSNRYLYRVKKLGVFGSYLTGQDYINDIDIALALEPKDADREKLRALIWQKVSKAKADDRRFANFSEELFWPQTEVLHYLKSRSRAISLHLLDEGQFETVEAKVLYEICD